MKINKKELIVGNTAYVVTKKYDSDQMKQVYHIVPAEIKKVGRKYITAIVQDRKSTRLNSSHYQQSRMPSSA